MDIMVELDFAMFEFKMSFGEYCSRAPIPLTPIVKNITWISVQIYWCFVMYVVNTKDTILISKQPWQAINDWH